MKEREREMSEWARFWMLVEKDSEREIKLKSQIVEVMSVKTRIVVDEQICVILWV